MKSKNGKIIAFVLVALMVLCCSSDIGFLSAFAETGSVAVQENGSGNTGENAAPEQAEQQTTEAPEGEPETEATEAPAEQAEPTEAEPEATEPADADPTEATGQTEAAEEDAVREQEIKAEVVSDPLYKDEQKKHRTKGYRYLARFWEALMDRKDGAEDEELKPEVTVSGVLPEGARAECTVIAMEDPAVFTEQGLFSLELVLYDGAGEVYLPEEPVTVTVKDGTLKQEIGEGSGLLVYSWTEAEERAEKYSKKYGRDVYAADALVRKSRSVDDELLKYEPYSKGKTYEDGEDAVRFSEKEEILDCGSDSVTFDVSYGEEADPSGAGHFAFTAQVKARTLKKTSGNARITVTGPLDRAVTLEVSELAKKDSEYKDYVKKTAETLDKEASEFSFARAFDIRLIDPANGEEFQPEDGVKVSIDLQDEEIGDEENVDVVHFAETENKGKTVETPEVMDAKTDGGEVAFATDGFSVYVVVGSGGEIVTHTWTYRFFIPKEGVDPGEQDMGDYYLVTGWPAKYDPVPVSTDSGETSAQTIKGGEKPVVPQQPEPEGKSFAGWYRGEPEGESDLRLSKTAYDFNAIPKTLEDDQTIDIFARYSDEYTVYFHDQYNGNLEDYPISSSRRGEISGNTAEVKISDVSAVYSGGSDMGFYGWSEEPIREQGKEADKDKKITTDTITIDGNKDLYPIFQPIHWLTYYSAEAGSGATYVPTRSFFAEDYEESLEVPVWAGHTFEGWYTGSLDGDRVTYSTRITDENGAIVNFPDTPGLERRGGRLYVTGDVTLYAKWSDETTVDYKIIIWKQKTTDEPGLPNSRKSYDLYESVIKTVPTGSTATIDAQYKAYATDSAHPELNGYDCRADADVPVNPQGYTVLNVYYDRNGAYVPSGSPHALIFDDSSDDRAAGLPVNYMGADAVEYGTSLLTGNQGGSYVPADPTKDNYTFTGWFADRNCTTRVFFDQESLDAYTGHDQTMLCDTMPDEALTLYAGWESDWYLVQVDPNYGTFNGSGGTWFWETFDGDLVQEYTQTTRDYVESSSGQYYYVKKDRAYYGYSGYEWDQSEPDRQTSYTTDPSEATEDGTFEKAPGVYSYAGWYEVKADGSEVPYDFSKHVDHHTTIKLHWKRSGVYYVSYNTKVTEGSQTLEGELSGSQDTTAYCDDADVLAALLDLIREIVGYHSLLRRCGRAGHLQRHPAVRLHLLGMEDPRR